MSIHSLRPHFLSNTKNGESVGLSTSSVPAVAIEALDFSYRTTEKILDSVQLEIPTGDFVCIIGPNGGGKTTLLKVLLGLLKPVSGRVRIFGKMPEAARRQMGYLPQHGQFDMDFPLNVLDAVLMGKVGTHRFGPYSSTDKAAAYQTLEEVGMAAVAHSAFAALSGGQRQRVLLARALVGNPNILILDEPTSFLDQKYQIKLLELLHRLNQRMTILMVSHDIGFVSSYVKTVICLNHQAAIHPTSQLTGSMIREIYGSHTEMIRHDHRCSEHGHEANSSDPKDKEEPF